MSSLSRDQLDRNLSLSSVASIVKSTWRRSVCSINSMSGANQASLSNSTSISSENECLLPKTRNQGPFQEIFCDEMERKLLPPNPIQSDFGFKEKILLENRNLRRDGIIRNLRQRQKKANRKCEKFCDKEANLVTQNESAKNDLKMQEMNLKIDECKSQMAQMKFKMEQMEKDLAKLDKKSEKRSKEPSKNKYAYSSFFSNLDAPKKSFQYKQNWSATGKTTNFFESFKNNFPLKNCQPNSFFVTNPNQNFKFDFSDDPQNKKSNYFSFFQSKLNNLKENNLGGYNFRRKQFKEFENRQRPKEATKLFPSEAQSTDHQYLSSTLLTVIKNQNSLQNKMADLENSNEKAFDQIMKHLVKIRETVEKPLLEKSRESSSVFSRKRGMFKFDFSNVNSKRVAQKSLVKRNSPGFFVMDGKVLAHGNEKKKGQFNLSGNLEENLEKASMKVLKGGILDFGPYPEINFDNEKRKLGEKKEEKEGKTEAQRKNEEMIKFYSIGEKKDDKISQKNEEKQSKQSQINPKKSETSSFFHSSQIEFPESKSFFLSKQNISSPFFSSSQNQKNATKITKNMETKTPEKETIENSFDPEKKNEGKKINFCGRKLDARLTTCFPLNEKPKILKPFFSDLQDTTKTKILRPIGKIQNDFKSILKNAEQTISKSFVLNQENSAKEDVKSETKFHSENFEFKPKNLHLLKETMSKSSGKLKPNLTRRRKRFGRKMELVFQKTSSQG